MLRGTEGGDGELRRSGDGQSAEVSTGTMLLQQDARTAIILVKVRFFTDTKGYRQLLGEQRDGVTPSHTADPPQSG